MTPESRITRAPGTRGVVKSSKPLASAVLASAPSKRHLPGPKHTITKGTIAKSPTLSSSSDSSSGKKCVNIGGKAITKTPGMQLKDASSNWFTSFEEFKDRFTIPIMFNVPAATPEDDFEAAIGGENCHFQEDKVALEEVSSLETEDEGKDGTVNGPTASENLEETGELKRTFFHLLREVGQGIAAVWRASCVQEVLFRAILCGVLFMCVEILIEDETVENFPPPT